MNEEKLASIVVVKRDGKKVAFDGTKIAIAIKKGFDSIDGKYTEDDTNKIYNKIIEKICNWERDRIKIEEIQDLIEDSLKQNGYIDVFESFSTYREKRAQSREIFFEEKRKHKFLKALEKIGLSTKEDMSAFWNNKNASQTLKDYGGTISEEFATSYLIKKRFSEEHENGDIYINDIEYYPMGTTQNTQINLERLFENGFSTENSSMREPQNIFSYAMLSVIAIESAQKDQHGEESIPAFDYYMAPGVLKTFKKEFLNNLYTVLEYTDYDKFIAINGIEREIEKLNTISFDISDFYRFTRNADTLKRMMDIMYARALKSTEKIVNQSMEAFVHNLNSICNEKLTTINIGTDISSEGRMITYQLMESCLKGVGENKKAISPKIVFKVKKGVNLKPDDPNYDLLVKATELAKQVDNISFSFLDASFNSQFYKEGDYNSEVAYFQDGTRVIDNVLDSDKAISGGRGVLSTTTINLSRIALKHQGDEKGFFNELDEKLDLVKDQLLERMNIQENKKINNFPFILQQNVWIDSERIKEDDKVRKSLKQGVLKIAFCGINEALVSLNGDDKLYIKIVENMRKKADSFCEKYNLNFTISDDGKEAHAKDFLDFDRAIFGKKEGVTDKDAYDSIMVIDDEKKKLNYVSQIQELCNGGHGLIVKSKDLLKTINNLCESDVGYAKIVYKG